MFKYSLEDVRRIAARPAAEVAAEEAVVRAALKVTIKEDTKGSPWGQHSMSEVLGFQEANTYCNNVAKWLHYA